MSGIIFFGLRFAFPTHLYCYVPFCLARSVPIPRNFGWVQDTNLVNL